MSDEIDAAQARNEFFTNMAIRRTLTVDRYADDDPLIINGHRCCLDCEKPIPQKRLNVCPGAKRCVTCQEKTEKRV
jgi:phage/conjugal plasmid C-4 type zinc finger TraR family protein